MSPSRQHIAVDDAKSRAIPGKASPGLMSGRPVLFVIILLTIGVYVQTLKNDFITTWDDHVYIITNETIRDLSFDHIRTIFASFHAANYHPLTTLSWAVEYLLFGLDPTYYHATSLVLHLINIILLFRLIFLLTTRLEWAAVVTLLFAVHPLHVEAVAFISQRKDVLYTLFFFASLISYCHYLKELKKSRLLLTLVLFLFSLLSKSMAVTLPVVLLLIDYYTGRRAGKKEWLEKIPFFLLSLIFGVIAIVSQKTYGAITDLPAFTLFERFFMLSYTMVFYSVKLVFPFRLSAMYGYPVKVNGMLPIAYYLSPLAILAVVWLVFKMKRFRKTAVFGLLFFLVTILPVLQFIPVGATLVADRYTYVPYVGLFFIVAHVFSHHLDSRNTGPKGSVRRFPLAAGVLLALFVTVCSVTTWQRTHVWANGTTLWSDVIDKNPGAAVAYFNRGVGSFNAKDYDKAIRDYAKAIEINSGYTEAYNNRAEAKERMGDLQGAVEDYNAILALDPDRADAYLRRGTVKSRMNDYEGALQDLSAAVQKAPADVRTYLARAGLHGKLSQYEQAIADLDRAVALDPNNATAYNNRGITKAVLKDIKGAVEDFKTALKLRPDYEDAKKNLAKASAQLRNY